MIFNGSNNLRIIVLVSVLFSLTSCHPLGQDHTGARPPLVESNCLRESAQFADNVCGAIERWTKSTQYKVSADGETLSKKTRQLVEQHLSPTVQSTEIVHQETFNVLQQDLADELINARACRAKLGQVGLNACTENNCKLRCEHARHNSLAILAKQQKKDAYCIANRHSTCLVKCRIGKTGSDKFRCNQQCAKSNNPHWAAECDSVDTTVSGLTSHKEIDIAYNSCHARCG